MTTTDTIPTIEREIKYSRQDRDYACYVNGQYIGSRANYSDAETLCDQVAYDLIADGLCATATELDGGSEPDAMAADHAVVAPACATCGGEGRCPDCDPIAPARHWSHDLPAYGADNCAGCGGTVPCRCDDGDDGRPRTAPILAPALLDEADRALSTCPGAFDVCGAEAHPSYAPFCQKCALALQRMEVAA